MKPIIILSIVCILLSTVKGNIAAAPGTRTSESDKVEERILALVKKMREVNAYLKAHKKDNAMLLVERRPEADFKYYYISVGLGNLGMYRATTHFCINPKTFQVYYVDFMDWTGNGLVPLQQWRRLRNNPEFQSLHKIRNGRLIRTNEII